MLAPREDCCGGVAAGLAGATAGREGAEGRARPPLPPRERGIFKVLDC